MPPVGSPEVSVCIPTYCRYSLLVRALNSVLRQDFESMEIIISDNASPDGSWEKTEQLCNLDHRIVVRRNESNLGWTGNLNECIKIARGKFIVFLCDDDELLPGMIELASEFLRTHPAVGFVHSAVESISVMGKRYYTKSSTKAILSAGLEALTETALSFHIIFSSVMVRRSCFEHLSYFIDSISADYEMWSRISVHYDVGYIEQPLARVYIHMISPAMTVERYLSGSERLWKRVASYFPEGFRDSPILVHKGQSQLANGLRSLGIQAQLVGDWRRGHAFLSAALKTSDEYSRVSYIKDLLLSVPRRIRFLIKGKSIHATYVLKESN